MLIDLVHAFARWRYLWYGFEGLRLPLDRCELHLYHSGTTPSEATIVFLHGLGTSSTTWINVLPDLRKGRRLIALDLPGFGASRITQGPPFFTLDEHLHVLEHLCTSMALKLFVLVGHSLGGWLAARYALDHPENVKRLILINTAGIYQPNVEELGKVFSPSNIDETRGLLNRLWFRYPWYFKPFARAVLTSLRSRHVSAFVASVRREDFLDERINELGMPVDLIWGDNDGLISTDVIETMRRAFVRLNVHHIGRCGHVPQLERPSALLRHLESILARG